MPYIKPEDRSYFRTLPILENGGELQYCIAKMIQEMLDIRSGERAIRYKDLEEIMGALSGAQAEFYRKVVAPYEEEPDRDWETSLE